MFCTKCGTQNEEGAVFCAQCGAPLGTAPAASGQPVRQNQPQQAARQRRKGKGLLIGIIAGVAALAVVAGLAAGTFIYLNSRRASGVSSVKKVSVTFSPKDGYKATNSQLNEAASILSTQLKAEKITNATVITNYGLNNITVVFPQVPGNLKALINGLGPTGTLEFKSDTYNNGKTFMTGADVKNAAEIKSQSGGYEVDLKLNSEGMIKFDEATKVLAPNGGIINIYMGTTLLESPVVETEISNGEVLIYNSGDPMTKAKADSLAAQINAGTLPFTLVASGYDSQGSAGQ